LFLVQKRRALIRPRGKEGIIHRQQTVRATPPWADQQMIRAIYKEARRLTIEKGELYVVDHIVPKRAKLVCGLHVSWNLRIIHWKENSRKGAWTWPGMPFEQQELFSR
jgi:5-methylcytosine-specific restriction endonuclease McrA